MSNYITTKELKREIKNLGFNAREDYRLIEVTSHVGDTLAKISKIQTHALNVLYPEFIINQNNLTLIIVYRYLFVAKHIKISSLKPKSMRWEI